MGSITFETREFRDFWKAWRLAFLGIVFSRARSDRTNKKENLVRIVTRAEDMFLSHFQDEGEGPSHLRYRRQDVINVFRPLVHNTFLRPDEIEAASFALHDFIFAMSFSDIHRAAGKTSTWLQDLVGWNHDRIFDACEELERAIREIQLKKKEKERESSEGESMAEFV